MNSEWKEIIEQEMEREAEAIMEEANSDPALKDVQAPLDLYDGLMEKIREYEKQKVYDQLSEEDKNIFHLISKMILGTERTTVDTDESEPVLYVDEDEVYREIEKVYGFTPVKFGYLPERTFGADIEDEKMQEYLMRLDNSV